VTGSDRLCLRLSTLAAQTLADARKLEMGELELHRPKEYDTRKQASDPITGGSAAVLTTIAVRFGSLILMLIGKTDRPTL
jgi:sterol 3beta-glucosyltransferase